LTSTLLIDFEDFCVEHSAAAPISIKSFGLLLRQKGCSRHKTYGRIQRGGIRLRAGGKPAQDDHGLRVGWVAAIAVALILKRLIRS
jgi:hypothetical protein